MRTNSFFSKSLTQFLLCAVMTFLLSAPLFYWLTKQFYAEDMIDIIESVEGGQGIPPLDLERDIILGVVVQFALIFLVLSVSMFITMVARSRKRERIQREFTENASHELQTPLAVVRTKLDLLMQENLNERQMQLVSDLYELTIRMGRMNRNLLLLAKIENDQYSAMEEVDVADVLRKSLPLYGVLLDNSSTRLTDRRTPSRRLFRANPMLLECLLKNLIVNAIRHTAEGGMVEITLDNASLTVSNTATEPRPLDAGKLFQRFRSGDAAHRGNGLGLAIVKAICDFHGWKVRYRFSSGSHYFIVKLPYATYSKT